MKTPLFLILGNQLFPFEHLSEFRSNEIFMCEDYGLCTYEKHHKQKILLFLSAMRSYRDDLREDGFLVTYHELDFQTRVSTFNERLSESLIGRSELVSFEVEDKFFEEQLQVLCSNLSIHWRVLESPLFLNSREDFQDFLSPGSRPFMKTFYERQRKKFGVLVDDGGEPLGGQWSYDSDNRKKLPKKVEVPKRREFQESAHTLELRPLVEDFFSTHPGELDQFWTPTTREGALRVLDQFLHIYLKDFGSYQDAITSREPFLFHSVISPVLNLGLITPKEVLDLALKYYHSKKREEIPLNSIEGFVRQLIGWREFIRGIYQNFSEFQERENFWGHHRRMGEAWYKGDTGIPPLDHAIEKVKVYGYSHHIERLMVLSNCMLLCEIEPKDVHRWFMELHIDSSDWVMGPNVYGMGQFSDGGLFATKPYICGSNYILKMSDYQKGDWCDTMDGLYWKFIDKNRVFMNKNPRLKMMVSTFDKMDLSKKERIFRAAEEFIEKVTLPASL